MPRTPIKKPAESRGSIIQEFEAWLPPAEREKDKALLEGIVTVDANVLVNLYKWDDDSRNDWFKIFKQLQKRKGFWVTNQALTEFFKTRGNFIGSPDSLKKVDGTLQSALDQVIRTYHEWVLSRGRELDHNDEVLLESVKISIGELQQLVTAEIEKHQKNFGQGSLHDPVLNKLDQLLDKDSYGEPFSPKELDEQIAIAEKRYDAKIPPGYEDDANNSENSRAKKSNSKFGDYLLWAQLLEHLSNLPESRSARVKYVVFVTADLKDDWWQTYAVGQDGESKKKPSRIPRQELVTEMRKTTGLRYIQMDPKDFIESARRAFPDLTIGEATVKTASMDPEKEWLDAEFKIMRYGQLVARAYIDGDAAKTKVMSGSLAKKSEVESIPPNAKRLRKELLESEILKEDEAEDEYFIFDEDYVFDAPSTAAQVILGNSSSQGRWKNSDQESPIEYVERI